MEEGVDYYHSNCKGWLCTQSQNKEIWRQFKEKVKNSIMKVKKKVNSVEAGKKRMA